jgi:hypothetical protein
MKKSKWDIIGQDIDKDNHEDYGDYFSYWYDGEDYFDHDYDEYYDYEYKKSVYQEHISKRGSRWSKHQSLVGNYIDMTSIYPKDVFRQMKIDYLLGVTKWENIKIPTLGDIKINKYSNGN